MTAGSFSIGVANGELAMLINGNGTKALSVSGGFFMNGAGFASASADLVTVKFNDTITDYSVSSELIGVDGIEVTLDAAMGGVSVSVQGLSVDVSGFVTLTVEFAF